MTAWFNRLSPTWQSLVVIAFAVAFGFVIAGAVATATDIPELVEENQKDIQRLSTRVQKIEVNQRDILEAIQLGNCLNLSAARNTPYQECL